MAADAGSCCRLPHTVIFVLFTLAPGLTGFSLRGLSKIGKVEKAVAEAAVTEVRSGSIIFNGKELNPELGSASVAAMGNKGMPNVDSNKLKHTGIFTEMSQQKEAMTREAALRYLNTALHCGQTKMKLKAMGPGAADLLLDNGKEYPLPLSHVPKTCGFSVRQNQLGLVLVVPYKGCNVLKENGNYVLPMRWLDAAVKLTCPILESGDSKPDSVIPKPAVHPSKLASSHKPWSFSRLKRHITQPSQAYDANNQYYVYWWYYNYYMYLAQHYPNYYYYYYYYPYYYSVPVATTVPPTTAEPATNATTVPTNTTSEPVTTGPSNNETTPQTPPYPYFYYYPVIQNYYGRPPYQTTTMPAPTTVQTSPTPVPTTVQTTPTIAPTTPTTAPTTPTTAPTTPTTAPTTPTTAPTTPTTAPTTQTTKKCSKKPTTGTDYQSPASSYMNYAENPFPLQVSYDGASPRAFSDYYQRLLEANYKVAPQPRAYPDVNWQASPWFSHLMAQNNPQMYWQHEN